MGCNGNCGSCGGCAKELVITPWEVEMLRKLGQIPFLPVARKMGDDIPVYLEDEEYTQEEYTLILQCLEKRGLIDIDYWTPLKGFDMSAYEAYPLKGSFGLTARGQAAVELLEYLGVE